MTVKSQCRQTVFWKFKMADLWGMRWYADEYDFYAYTQKSVVEQKAYPAHTFNHSFVNQYDNLYSLRGMVIGWFSERERKSVWWRLWLLHGESDLAANPKAYQSKQCGWGFASPFCRKQFLRGENQQYNAFHWRDWRKLYWKIFVKSVFACRAFPARWKWDCYFRIFFEEKQYEHRDWRYAFFNSWFKNMGWI